MNKFIKVIIWSGVLLSVIGFVIGGNFEEHNKTGQLIFFTGWFFLLIGMAGYLLFSRNEQEQAAISIGLKICVIGFVFTVVILFIELIVGTTIVTMSLYIIGVIIMLIGMGKHALIVMKNRD